MHVCVCVYIYIYIYIHTYMCIHMIDVIPMNSKYGILALDIILDHFCP